MKHSIEIEFHDARQSVENICILGAMVKDKKAKKYLNKLNTYIQKIWLDTVQKQQDFNMDNKK